MDNTYILPFVTSVQNVFETMLQMPVQTNAPELKNANTPNHDVSGIIGMAGDVEGSVVLSFPTATAERIASLFTGTEMTCDDPDFADAIGELVNMVSGGAKAQFKGKQVSISCPSVVVGPHHQVYGRKDVISLSIPCQCDVGDFNVEVSIKQNTAASADAA